MRQRREVVDRLRRRRRELLAQRLAVEQVVVAVERARRRSR